MRITGNGMTLHGAEGASPPLPFITVDDTEGESLLALYPKNIRRVDAAIAPAAEVVPPVAPEAPADPEPEAETPVVGDVESETVDEPVVENTEADDDEAARARVQAIRDAVELLGDDDLVKNGERTGKPKVKAVADILGDEAGELTADEIDAAIAPAAE